MRGLFLRLVVIVLFTSCIGNGDTIYRGASENFYPVSEQPRVYVIFNKKAGNYIKVIEFRNKWVLNHPGYSEAYDTNIEPGFHLADGVGYNGYDFEHTFSSIREAIKHARKCGNLYVFSLGSEYQYHDGALYSVYPFKKLKKE